VTAVPLPGEMEEIGGVRVGGHPAEQLRAPAVVDERCAETRRRAEIRDLRPGGAVEFPRVTASRSAEKPPKSTTRPRAASNVIACERRVDGPRCSSSTHSLPSHCHVSARSPCAAPPNRMTRARVVSKAIAWPKRADGPLSATCVHSSPSHSQVSPSSWVTWPVSSMPPKSTIFFRASSNTIEACRRGIGPMSSTCVQSRPSHSQVSFRPAALGECPLKSTTFPRCESKADV
jgi:hypothetical protein